MLRKMVVPTMLAVTALAATVPAAASAQSFGFYIGSGYPGYDDEDARRDAGIAHERWEERERADARRRSWAPERCEQERAERAWNHERWERRHDWDEDDDD